MCDTSQHAHTSARATPLRAAVDGLRPRHRRSAATASDLYPCRLTQDPDTWWPLGALWLFVAGGEKKWQNVWRFQKKAVPLPA